MDSILYDVGRGMGFKGISVKVKKMHLRRVMSLTSPELKLILKSVNCNQ